MALILSSLRRAVEGASQGASIIIILAARFLNGLLPNYIALKFLRFSAVYARKQETAKEI